MTARWAVGFALLLCALASQAGGDEFDDRTIDPDDYAATTSEVADPDFVGVSFDDALNSEEFTDLPSNGVQAKTATFLRRQEQPLDPAPSPRLQPGLSPSTAALGFAGDLWGRIGAEAPPALGRSLGAKIPSKDYIGGVQSKLRVTTDAGNLLGKSPSALGVTTQKRTPIVNDPRSRGQAVGDLLADGSFWFPARQDLDTMLSKIDSRLLEDITIIKGPYSARYGPGFQFIDMQLLPSPRFEGGFQNRGSTTFDYNANGEQFYGRESVWGGDSDWGYRVDYGHRTGSDYTAGDGRRIPSSYKSREWNFTVGADLSYRERLEFRYLRLDQTDVEFPGQAYDFDFLVTNGWELEYMLADTQAFDLLTVETWFNDTHFAGNSQNPAKRRDQPVLDALGFIGFTNARQSSTGYTIATTWGEPDERNFTLGTDLRRIGQRIDELNSVFPNFFLLPGVQPQDVPQPAFDQLGFVTSFGTDRLTFNKAVPKSAAVNPGVFFETLIPLTDDFDARLGGRYDHVSTSVYDQRVFIEQQPVNIFLPVFVPPVPSVFFPIPTPPFFAPLATPVFAVNSAGPFALDSLPDRNFDLFSVFLTGEYDWDDNWTPNAGLGFAKRAPTLTELYSFNGTFLAILQRGGNLVFGNPALDPEQNIQLDLGLKADYGWLRCGAQGFHAWIHDYITLRTVVGFSPQADAQIAFAEALRPGFLAVQPVQFVNTGLATLIGGEAYAEVDLNPWLTAFVTGQCVFGRDLDRAQSGQPTIAPLPGSFPIFIPNTEPLPMIAPPEGRVGLRLHEAGDDSPFGVEISARLVARQDLVARTLRVEPTPGFTTFDLRTYWQPRDSLMFVAGVENFTNKFYREHLDLRPSVFQPGMNAYAGTEVRY